MTIAPSKVFAFLLPSRQPIAIDKLRPQTTDWAVEAERLIANQRPTYRARLSTAAFGIFVISLITIEFARRSNLVATLWPSNAIILAALLRHARRPMFSALLLAGGAAANSVAGLACRKHLAIFCVTMFPANIVEIATALALLKLFRVDASNLSSLRNLLTFIASPALRRSEARSLQRRDFIGRMKSPGSPCVAELVFGARPRHDYRRAVPDQRHVERAACFGA